MKDKQLEACLTYFRERQIFCILFEKFREKYASLGHIGGSVTLTGLTMEDKEQLGGFLQKNYRGNKTVTVSATALQRALDESRFSGISWVTIMEAYFNAPLVGNRERVQRHQAERTLFFQRIMERYQQQQPLVGDQAGDEGARSALAWLTLVLEQRAIGYRHLMQQYKEAPKVLEAMLPLVLSAADALPAYEERVERLPIFAARITGDPHYFDEGTLSGKLLELFIIDHYQLVRAEGLAEPEWKNQVLFQAGILKDALSNVTIAYGVHGSRQGVLHDGIEGFFQFEEPIYLTLQTLGELDDLWSEQMFVVYVLENPAIFSALIEQYPSISAVCTNGQPRLASLVLLDKLSAHSILKYAGDFDPEGLMIAQNLKRRYLDKLEFWGYEKAYYSRYRSNVVLSEERLKKLHKIDEPALLDIKEAMLMYGCATYQEKMLEIYMEELQELWQATDH